MPFIDYVECRTCKKRTHWTGETFNHMVCSSCRTEVSNMGTLRKRKKQQ